MTVSEKALYLLRYLPRMDLKNVERSTYTLEKNNRKVGQFRERFKARKIPFFRLQTRYLPVGFNTVKPFTPFFKKFPREPYYADIKHRRQYPPLSLHSLQMMLDAKLLSEDEPIDLASIYGTNHYRLDPLDNCFGVHLTDEGVNCFKARKKTLT